MASILIWLRDGENCKGWFMAIIVSKIVFEKKMYLVIVKIKSWELIFEIIQYTSSSEWSEEVLNHT